VEGCDEQQRQAHTHELDFHVRPAHDAHERGHHRHRSEREHGPPCPTTFHALEIGAAVATLDCSTE
jgi:hypothetical protein